jgi:hypothetical protein
MALPLGDHHFRHLRPPPTFYQHPPTRLDHSRGGGLSPGPAEADGVCKSGAQRLRFRPALRGGLWAPRPPGDGVCIIETYYYVL